MYFQGNPIANPLAPGTLLHDRYRVVGLAGQGRFGRTYLARDQKRQQQLCVLKEFLPLPVDPETRQTQWQQFQAAVAILYRLQHSQLPRFQVAIAQADRVYWVREYIEGKSYAVLLHERRATGQTFSEAEVVLLLTQLLPVLHYLHRHQVIHQNLSLDSVILRHSDRLPVLIDIGLIRNLVARLQLHPIAAKTPIGEPGFMPPEQAQRGKTSPSSDFYALAAMAIALLTGKDPTELYNAQTQRFDWEQWAIVQPEFGRILRRMLHPNPKQRFTSALQISQALQVLASAEPRSLIPPISSRGRSPNRDTRAAVSFVAACGLLLAAIAWRLLSALPPEPKSSPAPPSPATSPPAAQGEPAPTPLPVPTPPPPPQMQLESRVGGDQELQGELRERRQKLELNVQFVIALVDEAFYAKYPEAKNKLPGTAIEQQQRQAKWNTIANTLLDKLQQLTPQMRRKLGSYRRANYDQWLTELGEKGPNSPTLDALANRRFAELFPALKDAALNPRTFGQIWFAVAEEQLETAKAQKAAEKRR
jgi:serine/threonine-protein kinase